MPDNAIQPDFGAALIAAEESVVQISAFDCANMPDFLTIGKAVDVRD